MLDVATSVALEADTAVALDTAVDVPIAADALAKAGICQLGASRRQGYSPAATWAEHWSVGATASVVAAGAVATVVEAVVASDVAPATPALPDAS